MLGVVAAGSGCDFVKSFGLPGDAVRAARHLAGDGVRRIDVGKVTFTAGAAEMTRYFANIAEAGLGGAVVARASRLAGFLGSARYFCGFWLTLPSFRPATVRLDADGQAFEWRAHNVVVANCRFYGGGMQISPKSEPDDGALDVLVMVGPKSDAFTMLQGIQGDAPSPPQHRGAPGPPSAGRNGPALPGRGGRGDAGHDAGHVRGHSPADPREGVNAPSRRVSRPEAGPTRRGW